MHLLPVMALYYSPQIKWPSFLLLLLTLFVELPSTASWDKCEERCDNNRLPGNPNKYILDCDKEYKTVGEINLCRSDCQFCDDEICKNSNPSIFRCPAPHKRNPDRCKNQCESVRSSWDQGKAYILKCSQEYSSSYEIEKCRQNCIHCPREICAGSTPDIFKCPANLKRSPPIIDNCLDRCNNNRPKYTTGPYTLSCFEEYATHKELLFCRGDSKFCPESVSTPYNPDIFHCPAGKPVTTTTTTAAPVIRGSCKKQCDDNRAGGTTQAYTLDCRKAYEFEDEIYDCNYDCWNCNRKFCNPHVDENIFHCPKISQPLPPPPPPTYEGPCQDRCDKNRGKGPYGLSNDAYTLNCEDKYRGDYTNIKRCKRDCTKFCPESVCSSQDTNLHHCPRNQLRKRYDDICSANRKYESTESYTLKCSTAYSTDLEIHYCRSYCADCDSNICDFTSDNDTYHCPASEHNFGRPDPYPDTNRWGSQKGGQGSTLVIVCIIIVLLLIVASIGVCIYCCVKKKRSAPTGQYYGAPGAGAYPMNYPASQSSGMSISGPRQMPSSQFGSNVRAW